MASLQVSTKMLEQMSSSFCQQSFSRPISRQVGVVKGLPPLRTKKSQIRNSSDKSGEKKSAIKAAAIALPAADIATETHGPPDAESDSGSAPLWAILSNEISIGPCPRSPQDLELLVQNTGIGGFVYLETADGCKQLGLDWEKFREKASNLGVVAVRISMKDDDVQDQASSLPEAVRAIAALVALGYKVHISCTNGVHRSPLAALGYLTFVKSMDFTQTVQLISQKNPAAQPHFDAWEEAKAKISAGDMKRVAQIAQHVSEKRIQSKKSGTPADDWMIAQRLLVAESFERGISTDVTLSDAIAKTESSKATKSVLEELALTKAEAEKASKSAMTSKERLEFYTNQLQAMKEREELARQTVESVHKDKELLSLQVDELKLKEQKSAMEVEGSKQQIALLSAKVAELEEKEIQLVSAAEIASTKVKELQAQVRVAQANEMAARKDIEAANARLESLAAKYASLEASLSSARFARDEANVKVKEVVAQIKSVALDEVDPKGLEHDFADLTRREAVATATAIQAQEKLEFLIRQIETIKSKEALARDAVKAANAKAGVLLQQVSDLKLREAMASNAAVAAKKEVSALKLKISDLEKELRAVRAEALQAKQQFVKLDANVTEMAAERVSDVVDSLQSELQLVKKRESEARNAVLSSNDRVEFFYRRMELMKQREEKAKKVTEERISLFTKQASELRLKLEAADKLAAESEVKIGTLSGQVEELSKKEQAAVAAAKAAGEKVLFYERHVEELKLKMENVKQAALVAKEKAKELHKKVIDLERREAMALAQAETFSEKAASLMQANAELEVELQEVKDRELKLTQALEEGTGMLQVAIEADKTIQELREEVESTEKELIQSRKYADKLAMDLEREIQRRNRDKPPPPNKAPNGRSLAKGLEEQLQKQMVTIQHSIAASGGESTRKGVESSSSSSLSVFDSSSGNKSEGEVFRDVILGALGVAALPFTLMSTWTGNGGDFISTLGGKSNIVKFPDPVVKSTSSKEFCEQLIPGVNVGKRVENFCHHVYDDPRRTNEDL